MALEQPADELEQFKFVVKDQNGFHFAPRQFFLRLGNSDWISYSVRFPIYIVY